MKTNKHPDNCDIMCPICMFDGEEYDEDDAAYFAHMERERDYEIACDTGD